MIAVYMGGPVSGGHFNPAVSLAVMLRGKLPAAEFVPYVAAQLAGAFLAALLAASLRGPFVAAPGAAASTGGAFVAELVFTFFLALVVLNVATTEVAEGNSYFGLAIGFTVMVGAFAVGDISGGAFNPAVGLGPAFVFAIYGAGSIAHVWLLYLVAPLAGGALAAAVFRLMHPDEMAARGAPEAVPEPPGR